MGIRRCQCFGMLNYVDPVDNFLYSANLCPDCKLGRSTFTVTSRETGETIFNSIRINGSICTRRDGVTSLTVFGEGFLGNSFALFVINLRESDVGNDEARIRLVDIEEDSRFIKTFVDIPDANLSVENCNG